jgi:formate dehydrogenase subunit gamma
MKSLEGPLLPILHGIQGEFGYVPSDSLPVIAEALNISKAEVHGVVTFYHDYRNHPAGRHVLKLCRAEACQSMGGDALAARMQQLLGLSFHETASDGSVTLEPVYCLGLCAVAPAAMLDGEVIGRLDADKLDDIAAEVRA